MARNCILPLVFLLAFVQLLSAQKKAAKTTKRGITSQFGLRVGLSLSERHTYKALADKTIADFNKSPLSAVAEYFNAQHKTPILIDTAALAAAGLKSDMPITLNIREITLESALSLLTKNRKLGWMIKAGVIHITSEKAADTTYSLHVYDVSVLCKTDQDAAKLVEAINKLLGTTKVSSLQSSVASFRKMFLVRGNRHFHSNVEKILSRLVMVVKEKKPTQPWWLDPIRRVKRTGIRVNP